MKPGRINVTPSTPAERRAWRAAGSTFSRAMAHGKGNNGRTPYTPYILHAMRSRFAGACNGSIPALPIVSRDAVSISYPEIEREPRATVDGTVDGRAYTREHVSQAIRSLGL